MDRDLAKRYHNALLIALKKENINYETEKRYSVFYQGERSGTLIVDLVVEDVVLVEIKAVTGYLPELFAKQLLAYLKASGLKVGLLVNFGNRSCQVKRYSY